MKNVFEDIKKTVFLSHCFPLLHIEFKIDVKLRGVSNGDIFLLLMIDEGGLL